MNQEMIETARLLARFKLQVRRSLDRAVDLGRLTADPVYCARTLAEIGAVAKDEELRTLLRKLCERLLAPPPAEQPAAAVEAAQGVRDHRFGARG
jgi:hypothetical protein